MIKIKYLYPLCLLLTLQGCGKKYVSGVDIEHAFLLSPEGLFDSYESTPKNRAIWLSDSQHSVRLILFPKDGSAKLTFRAKDILRKKGIKIQNDSTFYQLNGGKEVPLVIKRSSSNDFSYDNYKIIPPSTMAHYYSSSLSVVRKEGGRTPINEADRLKVENETYRYVITYKLNDKTYFVDVKFQLEINSKYFIGIPGGHP